MSNGKEAGMQFGEYIEALRKARGKSLRATAAAVGTSPQFFSEIEKGRRSSLTAERMGALRAFLDLTDEESGEMYNKAAEARKYKDVVVPQDFSDYIVERDYAMAALRMAKKLDAGQDDWQRFVDELIKRKGEAL